MHNLFKVEKKEEPKSEVKPDMPKVIGGEAKDKPICLDEDEQNVHQQTNLSQKENIQTKQKTGEQPNIMEMADEFLKVADNQDNADGLAQQPIEKPKMNGHYMPSETITVDKETIDVDEVEQKDVIVKEEGDDLLDEFLKNETFISAENDVDDFLLQ